MDELKLKKTKENEITLIHIPFWWDKKLSSLRGTIATIRPDVLSLINNSDVPIPLQPLSSKTDLLKSKRNNIKSTFMLATNWNKEEDPTGW